MANKLYVGNLPFSATKEEVTSAFSQHGTVDDVILITDRETGRSKGFAFVTMGSDEEANTAKSALNGVDLGGRNIVVNEARERQPRSGGSGGNRGGGNRNDRY